MWNIHTLVFDLDDTLIAERDYVASGFAVVGEWVNSNWNAAGFAPAALACFAAGIRGKIFNEALAACGLDATPERIAQLVQIYRAHVPTLDLQPDAADVLTWAKERFRLAVISDGPLISQQNKVQAVRLAEIVPQIILTDAWGREFWKPSRRAFEEVMGQGERPAQGFVYIADNPRKDFLAPRALGWRSVRLRRPGGEHCDYEAAPHEAADIEISDLRALKHLVTRSARGAS